MVAKFPGDLVDAQLTAFLAIDETRFAQDAQMFGSVVGRQAEFGGKLRNRPLAPKQQLQQTETAFFAEGADGVDAMKFRHASM